MSSFRVLIVDDSELDRMLLTTHLRPEGYELDIARDGAEGWEKLAGDAERFSVVLLDRQMPRMNGMELLAKIKSDERLATLPVIMQTALSRREEMIEGIRAGAYYYLTKPYDVEMLKSVVRTAIEDYGRYHELQMRVQRGTDSLRLMREALFAFRTVEQANGLGALLAHTCPNPPATVVGLTELLVNAVEHGNLGITYEEKSRLTSSGEWQSEMERRLALPQNAAKEATISFKRSAESIRFVIRDQGAGFDWQSYLQVDPKRAFDTHGRGIAIANHMSFSHLEYRGCGNEVVGTVSFQ